MNKRKLKNVWFQLDRACGELENASHTMAELGMDTDSIRDAFNNIVARKNEVEEELLKQGGKLF